MAKDSFYPQSYINNEGKISKHYVWASKIEKATFTCPYTGQTLTCEDIYEEPEVQAPGIKTMTKDRIVMDRKRRSTNHFKKEIYSNFAAGSDERKHFSKKLGLKE